MSNYYKEPDTVQKVGGRYILNDSDCNVSLGMLEGILNTRDGKAIAEIGQYDPFQKRLHVEKKELVKFIKNGAYPTNTVRHLMTKIL